MIERSLSVVSAMLAITVWTASTGCIYSMRSGGGLPRHIKTISVAPFENPTATPELQRELHEALREQLQSKLGVREASPEKANALVTGSVERYEADIPVSYTTSGRGNNSPRRMLQLVINVQIVDQVTGKILYQKKSLTAEGQYEERAEAQGRRDAINKIVSEIVQGAQSQW
jgi:outer membrane lipopolysaccharide assembly protein LptE/RlpB